MTLTDETETTRRALLARSIPQQSKDPPWKSDMAGCGMELSWPGTSTCWDSLPRSSWWGRKLTANWDRSCSSTIAVTTSPSRSTNDK